MTWILLCHFDWNEGEMEKSLKLIGSRDLSTEPALSVVEGVEMTKKEWSR